MNKFVLCQLFLLGTQYLEAKHQDCYFTKFKRRHRCQPQVHHMFESSNASTGRIPEMLSVNNRLYTIYYETISGQ